MILLENIFLLQLLLHLALLPYLVGTDFTSMTPAWDPEECILT